jgi:uncharacterized protein (UPF0216 family)
MSTQNKNLRSILERIGRRNVGKDGKVSWMSQPEWEIEQRKLETEKSRASFSICLDDSDKKKKIIITAPALVQVVKKILPLTSFETVLDGVSFEEPYSALFHYLPEMRSDMKEHGTKSEELDDIEALEYFLDKCQPQNKNLRDSYFTRQQSEVSFESLWALFKPGEDLVITDKFQEKRLFRFTHIEKKLVNTSWPNDRPVSLLICGWCIVWDAEHKCFIQQT